jgi:membrane-associated phospholipid phosphatase
MAVLFVNFAPVAVRADPLPSATPPVGVPPAIPPASISPRSDGGMPDSRRFTIDPVSDFTLIALNLSFSVLDEILFSTGEIAPQRPGDPSRLFGIDRVAIDQTFDPNATGWSNAGLYAVLGFAALDPIFSGFRENPWAAVVDGTIYAESLSTTFALTELAKIAVRRPRPSAYVEQAALDRRYGPNGPAITDTDQSLSFFSGHTAICAATTATATYLAFSRAPESPRPWITLAIGTLVTTGVGIERVRAGAHFPTDVIAGAIAGTGVGILVPHWHRRSPWHAAWLALSPIPHGMGASLEGFF